MKWLDGLLGKTELTVDGVLGNFHAMITDLESIVNKHKTVVDVQQTLIDDATKVITLSTAEMKKAEAAIAKITDLVKF